MKHDFINFIINNKVVHTMPAETTMDDIDKMKDIMSWIHNVDAGDICVQTETVWDADLERGVRTLLMEIPHFDKEQNLLPRIVLQPAEDMFNADF